MSEALTIECKCRTAPAAVVKPTDFSGTVQGPIAAEIILQNPHLSLYCLDHPRRQALFVEVDDGFAASAEPFLYMAQYARARRLLALSYDTLAALAETIANRPAPLVLIHSPGRSGSTVLSKAFQRVAATTSLSEPDVYSQIVQLRAQGAASDEELTALLRWATLLLFKPAFTRGAALWVLKVRSWCIEIADLLAAAFPTARNVFLHRDLQPWLRSSARTLLPLLPPEGSAELGETAMDLADFVPLLKAHLSSREATKAWSRPETAPIEIVALLWLSVMRRFAELERRGVAMHAVSYEEMVREPRRTLQAIFRYVGLPAGAVATALEAFATDAQQGTSFARDAGAGRGDAALHERQWKQVRALLARYPLEDALLSRRNSVRRSDTLQDTKHMVL